MSILKLIFLVLPSIYTYKYIYKIHINIYIYIYIQERERDLTSTFYLDIHHVWFFLVSVEPSHSGRNK